jgi:beta propeller repeat protein
VLVLLAPPAAALSDAEILDFRGEGSQMPGTETLLPAIETFCPIIRVVEISGDHVVWDKPGGMTMGGMSVVLYDIASGTGEVIDQGLEASGCHDPDVDGRTIAYSTGNGDGEYVALYDITSGEKTREFAMGSLEFPGNEGCPAVAGNFVVWECSTGSYFRYDADDTDIYLYDRVLRELTCICSEPANQTKPQMSGNLVVWEDYRNGSPDIYLYDLKTQTERPVCTGAAEQSAPAIGGNLVVWEDTRNGDRDIYCYDLESGREFSLCSAELDQWSPAISGNRIVWVDDRDEEGDQEWLYNTIHLFTVGEGDPAGSPDLIITDLSWAPANPAAGKDVIFGATIQNVGDVSTPEGVIHGVLFRIDEGAGVWSDSHTAALDPGESVTLTANGGSGGTGVWSAQIGSHTVTAVVDDVNRIDEGNEGNNTLSASFEVEPGSAMLLPFPGCTGVPVDTDGDGLFEDINGNRRADFNDVVIYYRSLGWIPANGLVHFFDFNENDRIDFDDVVTLYRMIL